MPSKIKRRPELLLQYPIPRALHGMSPRSIMGGRQWEREKLIVRTRTEGRCEACNRKHKDGVEAHECYDIDYKRCIMTFREVVGLCRSCHLYIHPRYAKSLAAKKEISWKEVDAIFIRGNNIVYKAGRPKVFQYPRFECWSEWRLIFNGKEYRARYRSEIEWRKRYAS